VQGHAGIRPHSLALMGQALTGLVHAPVHNYNNMYQSVARTSTVDGLVQACTRLRINRITLSPELIHIALTRQIAQSILKRTPPCSDGIKSLPDITHTCLMFPPAVGQRRRALCKAAGSYKAKHYKNFLLHALLNSLIRTILGFIISIRRQYIFKSLLIFQLKLY
jgi:hypothetical protein